MPVPSRRAAEARPAAAARGLVVGAPFLKTDPVSSLALSIEFKSVPKKAQERQKRLERD